MQMSDTMNRLARMASVSAATAVTRDDECDGLIRRAGSLFEETASALDLARDSRAGDFSGIASELSQLRAERASLADELEEGVRAWQLGGFSERGASELGGIVTKFSDTSFADGVVEGAIEYVSEQPDADDCDSIVGNVARRAVDVLALVAETVRESATAVERQLAPALAA